MSNRAMNFFKWVEKFRPVTNHIDQNASSGCMFETYGREFKYVEKKYRENPNKIWTLVDGDNGKTYIVTGFHFVNRIGYFITSVPYTKEQEDLFILY